MKKIKFIQIAVFILVFATACTKTDGIDSDLSFLNSTKSSSLTKIFEISTDNSGNVKITPSGEGVSSYTILFGQGTGSAASAKITPGNSATHAYPEGSYTVTINAADIAGKVTTTTYPLTVTYRAPLNLVVNTLSDMKVNATALYANSFLVFYGDVANETGTPMAIGQTLPAHIYPAGGPYDLKVVAQSGGAATSQLVKTLFGLPLSFESTTMDYFFGTFGNVNFTKVANPSATGLNTSATVGKYEKTVGAATWSGTYSPLNIPINFTQGNKVKVLLYNPDATNIGKNLNVELESGVTGTGATGNGVAVLKVPITTSGAWEELVFDFSSISAIPATARFGQIVFRFNDAASGTGEIIYIDNIRLTN
ncbi:MAG: hypothetical protein K2Q21_06595 [Chitinophagaceae bacterium]|nr:hypothetical protein [Chitinophagaceae bacterium]